MLTLPRHSTLQVCSAVCEYAVTHTRFPDVRDADCLRHKASQAQGRGRKRSAEGCCHTGVLPHHCCHHRFKCLTSPAIFHQRRHRRRGHGGRYWRRGRGGAPRVTERAGRAPQGTMEKAPGGGAMGGHQEERLGRGHQEVGSRGGAPEGTPSH